MQQEYDSWNKVKKDLSQVIGKQFENRQIWWTSIGYNLGDESFGKNHLYERPVLVLRKLSSNAFVGIPFTTTKSEGSYFYEYRYTHVDVEGKEVIQIVYLMLHQVRIFSNKRLLRKLGKMAEINFQEAKEKFHKLF